MKKKKLRRVVCLMFFMLSGVSSLFAQLQDDVRVYKRVDSLMQLMTIEEKIILLGGKLYANTLGIPRLNIPGLIMADGPMGVRGLKPEICYPGGICLASSWNEALANRFGKSIGSDARSINISYLLAPGVNLYRSPTCGRNFEYYGEDPFLVGKMAANMVKGVQSQQVIATVKHYAANNQEWDRNNVSSDLDERTMQEVYLAPFRACVQEGGVGAVMTSYNLVNNVHAAENDWLINQVLKKQWGFKGVVMSDWESVYSVVNTVNSGLDLEMPTGLFMNANYILPAMKNGTITENTINQKVRRILYNMIKFGLFDQPNRSQGFAYDRSKSDSTALEVAREGVVLLRNENNILPLKKNLKKIVVIGPSANPAVTGAGGSSKLYPVNPISILDGITKIAGKNAEVYSTNGLFVADKKYVYGVNFYTFNERGQKVKGLKAEYFKNMNLQGKSTHSQIDTVIDVKFSRPFEGDSRLDSFSVRWSGKVVIPVSGKYRFFAQGDDGYRLVVDNDTILNDFDMWRGRFKDSCISLTSGEHDIKFEFMQYRYEAWIKMGYVAQSVLDDKNKLDQDKITNADAVVLCVGFNSEIEGEGNDRAFELQAKQVALLNRVTAYNKNVIVVLTGGGNMYMKPWINSTGAVLHAWYPGQAGGQAVAEILFGHVNPSGKLPASFEFEWKDNPAFNSYYDADKGGPACNYCNTNNDKRVFYSEGVFTGYRHYDRNNIKPMFPFGYGLSYTSFAYSNISVSKPAFTDNDSLVVTFTITNTGKVFGKEVAQLYVSDKAASVPRPVKELKGFAKVGLKAGESKQVSITVKSNDFKFFDMDLHDWKLEPGDFDILIGSSAEKLELKTTVKAQ